MRSHERDHASAQVQSAETVLKPRPHFCTDQWLLLIQNVLILNVSNVQSTPNWTLHSLAVACTDILKGRGEKKGTLGCILAPKRAL